MFPHEAHELERAEENAPRMADMNDEEIRTAIRYLVENCSVPNYSIATSVADQQRTRDHLSVLRTELVRRACLRFEVPFLGSVARIVLSEIARNGPHITSQSRIVAAYHALRDLGLLVETDGAFKLTALAQDVLDWSHDDATNLEAALRARIEANDAVIAVIAEQIKATHAETAAMNSVRAIPAAAGKAA